MKLTDLGFIINPFQEVVIYVDYEEADRDTKVIKGTWHKINKKGLEPVSIIAQKDLIIIRCKEL